MNDEIVAEQQLAHELFNDLHPAIGRAVLTMQLFDFTFTLVCRLTLDPKWKGKTIDELRKSPLDLGDFRVPTTAVIKDLKEKGVRFDADFERDALDVVEKRHYLVHRCLIAGRIFDAEQKMNVLAIANAIVSKAIDLNLRLLAIYYPKFRESVGQSQEEPEGLWRSVIAILDSVSPIEQK